MTLSLDQILLRCYEAELAQNVGERTIVRIKRVGKVTSAMWTCRACFGAMLIYTTIWKETPPDVSEYVETGLCKNCREAQERLGKLAEEQGCLNDQTFWHYNRRNSTR